MEYSSVKVELITNFSVPDKKNNLLSLPYHIVTLYQLLEYLGEKVRFDFVDARGGVLETDLEILLNGKDFRFLPQGLETPLKDGDSLEIHLLPLGGG